MAKRSALGAPPGCAEASDASPLPPHRDAGSAPVSGLLRRRRLTGEAVERLAQVRDDGAITGAVALGVVGRETMGSCMTISPCITLDKNGLDSGFSQLGSAPPLHHKPKSSRNCSIWCMRSCRMVTIPMSPLPSGFQ